MANDVRCPKKISHIMKNHLRNSIKVPRNEGGYWTVKWRDINRVQRTARFGNVLKVSEAEMMRLYLAWRTANFPNPTHLAEGVAGIPAGGRPTCLNAVEHDLCLYHPETAPGYVYFLLHRDEVVYVGQTRELRSRFRAHRRAKDIKFDSVYYLRCTKYQMLELEMKYIELLKPRYNFEGVARRFISRDRRLSAVGQQF
jgi:hypothetical protein